MWLSLQAAHQRLADLTHHTAVPAYLDHVNRYTFSATSHVLIGDMAVPGYKYRQQWRFLDRDIQKSGKRLAGLEIDPGDLVDAGLEASEPHTWRSRVWQWISQATYESELPRMQGPGVLSKNFTGQQLPEAFTQRTIASTRPLPLMVWSGKEWLVPRAYAAVLDRAEEVEAGLAAQDDVCSGCGTPLQQAVAFLQRLRIRRPVPVVCCPGRQALHRPSARPPVHEGVRQTLSRRGFPVPDVS
ncbi:hypothetical protein [Streptomyces sp. JCM 35825]|uniref:hypothetical protein n=1 Tax=Streptomyces sp. JCM 35825 TaxID=2930259 RepID=UPI00234A5C08|nr:hypothetical protein [Streptomyces sp. JCM 35825]WCL89597.1 hypothetical protein PPN52_36195 [Streptomyces sp. JCM 35825]